MTRVGRAVVRQYLVVRTGHFWNDPRRQSLTQLDAPLLRLCAASRQDKAGEGGSHVADGNLSLESRVFDTLLPKADFYTSSLLKLSATSLSAAYCENLLLWWACWHRFIWTMRDVLVHYPTCVVHVPHEGKQCLPARPPP